MNAFTVANTTNPRLTNTRTENGALSYATMGSEILDQFGKAGTARNRDIQTVWNEQANLWAENPEIGLKFPFYLRMITRKVKVNSSKTTDSVQRGQGARDESFKRLLWIAHNHPQTFYQNLWLLPLIGSWKDLWVLLTMDDTLNKKEFFITIAEGIKDTSNRDLIKKYLPRIRSNSKCTTEWAKKTNALAKEFAKFAGWNSEMYRAFKSTGKAHEFQNYICKGLYDKIEWGKIPGKALLNLVSGNFLKRHGLENKYIAWLKKQPVAKFNGYPYELGLKLGRNCNVDLATRITIDKQFKSLIATGKDNSNGITGNVLCALDTSGSMGCHVNGGPNGLSSYDVCISLGIYFSELNTGAFHNTVALFDTTSKLLKLNGEFSDKWRQLTFERGAMGSTNFQSLIDLLVKTRMEEPNIPESEYPQTLLVVTDNQFNPCGKNYFDICKTFTEKQEQTNYEMAMEKLSSVFSKEFVENFKIVWWYCAGRNTSDYPTTSSNPNTYLISGFDGSTINFLLGGEETTVGENKTQPTMQDIIDKVLHQEILNTLTIVD